MKKNAKKTEYWTRTEYKGFTLKSVVYRVGALTMLAYPSRVDASLFYPDGRVVKDERNG